MVNFSSAEVNEFGSGPFILSHFIVFRLKIHKNHFNSLTACSIRSKPFWMFSIEVA